MSETLCHQWRSRSFCAWRTSKTNPGTSGRNSVSQIVLCRQWWTWNIQLCHTVTLSDHNRHILQKKISILVFKENLSILTALILSETLLILTKVTACTNLTRSFTTLLCYSATDALKGEGLQEGVDWLQGTIKSGCEQWQDSESSPRAVSFTVFIHLCTNSWDVSESLILFSFYHLHCLHSNFSIDQIIQWVLGGRPVLRYGGTQQCSVSVTGLS